MCPNFSETRVITKRHNSTYDLRDPVYIINTFTISQIPPCAKPHSVEETLIEPYHETAKSSSWVRHPTCQGSRPKRGSLREIREHVQKRRSQLDGDWIPALAKTYEAKIQLFPNIKIMRCVRLGLGSLSEAIFRHIPRDDPIQQLRFLTRLLELLGKQYSVKKSFSKNLISITRIWHSCGPIVTRSWRPPRLLHLLTRTRSSSHHALITI